MTKELRSVDDYYNAYAKHKRDFFGEREFHSADEVRSIIAFVLKAQREQMFQDATKQVLGTPVTKGD